jgi:hypothetical protein
MMVKEEEDYGDEDVYGDEDAYGDEEEPEFMDSLDEEAEEEMGQDELAAGEDVMDEDLTMDMEDAEAMTEDLVDNLDFDDEWEEVEPYGAEEDDGFETAGMSDEPYYEIVVEVPTDEA